MNVYVVSTSGGSPKPALIVETARGREVRCPERGHLLGVLNESNQLVVKYRNRELMIVEVSKA